MQLRPMTDDDLKTVLPWFRQSDTLRWIGGPETLTSMLRRVGVDYRVYLGEHDGAAGVVAVDRAADRAGVAMVVDPERRGQGLGVRLLASAMALDEWRDVVEWSSGINHGNLASIRMVESLGFRARTNVDADGYRYYAHGPHRDPWHPIGSECID